VKKKAVWIVMGTAIVLLVIGFGGGAAYTGLLLPTVNKDKQFIIEGIENTIQKKSLNPKEISQLVPGLLSKYGNFKRIVRVDGVPIFSEAIDGGTNLSYNAVLEFEKGRMTLFIRVNNESEQLKIVYIEAVPYEKKRFRIRDKITKNLPI
jgi:hypothetical protein